MRTRKKKWTAGELADNPCILREPTAHAMRFKEFFGDGAPIHMEIGCGKGRFITQNALRHPELHYIALERAPAILAAAAKNARALPNPPVFLLMDAEELTEYFRPGDIERLYINFCDPWPGKKKWAKRRLTHGNFLALYTQLEIPEIFFKTDNRSLFEFSLESFCEHGWRMKNISLDLHQSNMPDNIMTEYEEKFSAKGMPIYRLEAYRR